ncbi:phosphate/phosphite/phosphonate ABC transporter substrate-binding protein [bacterium]|nr:MAG: phosphate/phosphite/phosphonate ABC transporter substrate-binding protein [bacterium]
MPTDYRPAAPPPVLPVFLAVLLFFLSGCAPGSEPEKVSLKSAPEPSKTAAPADEKSLRVAVAAMISPKETFIFYKDLVNYIGEKVSMPVTFVQRETYEEVNKLLEKNELDLAFVCTGAYVEGHDSFGMELLAAPVAYGQPLYYSYVIVPKDSGVSSLEGLRGKSFAFTDPLSNTGKLAPVCMLASMKETPESFFKATTYTYSHDKSIESVARKIVDGAAVDSLVWDYLDKKTPRLTSQTRIIKKSEPYGIPPVVVSKTLDPGLKEKLKAAFLSMHEDEKGKKILSEIMIDRFTRLDDGKYDSVRAMKKWVEANAGK